MPHLPLDWWPLVLLVQQTFILGRLWARLVRLAGGVALYQGLVDRVASRIKVTETYSLPHE